MNTELHPSTQLIIRNIERITGTVLLVNPPELASIAAVMATNPLSSVQTTDYAIYTEALAEKYQANFGTHYTDAKKFNQIILFLPKSDLEIEMTLHWISEALDKGSDAEVIVVGQNNAGIKSAKKTLGKFIGPVVFSDSARHSALYGANKTVTLKPFNLNDWWQSYEIPTSAFTLPSTPHPVPSLRIFSLPGVFSHGKLDEGTELLLKTFTHTSTAKRILDWGCGAGAISLALAASYPLSEIDMVDSSALALASAKKTLAENSITNYRVFATNVFSEVKEQYDLIVANPPFHKGHDTYYTDSELFIREAKSHLEPHGQLRVVANIFLRYEQLMEEQFGYVKAVSKTNKYKILETVYTPTIQRPSKKKFKKKRTLEEAGFVDIRDLDKLIVQDVEDFDDED